MTTKFNILALSGGGLFGYGQALTLQDVPRKNVHLVAGTSVGAANALAFSVGKMDQAIALYQNAKKVFPGYWWRRFRLRVPRYPDKVLNATLRDMFRGRFGDSPIPTLITADAIDQRRPKIFRSWDADDADWPMWEVARASMAAHNCFAPWKGYGDGGIHLNDPVCSAMIAAFDSLGIPFASMRAVGVGTGMDDANTKGGDARWLFTLAIQIIDAMLRGGSVYKERKYASTILKSDYKHLDFSRPAKLSFDNPEVVSYIATHWLSDIQNNRALLLEWLNA